MKVLLEFDEKEFWIQLFSITARREARAEDEDGAASHGARLSRPRDEAVASKAEGGVGPASGRALVCEDAKAAT
ncbi:MAG TPA: hypothetical protein VN939_00430 [Chthoniobacterales bacterium]|jgi:hypothetical protein|nr:hypothetical protein [Chthoniobacterales bacterium]